MRQTIAVVHNAVRDSSLPDEQDVLTQVKVVSQAVEQLGYEPVAVPCSLDLEALKKVLAELQPMAVFNLVESLDGHGRLIHVVPALVEALGIPYTGCPAEAVYATSHKVMAKERMRAAGLPTADWINPMPPDIPWAGAAAAGESKSWGGASAQGVWIIKSLWEHASLGLEQENLVTGTPETIALLLTGRARDLGGACFAERFIEGREFNLSLIGMGDTVRVLPPAEILFKGFGDDKPKIVGYRAKWIPEADEYHNTPRCFDFPARDAALLFTLEDLACRCWRCFGLRGYARVDFRVDVSGNPFILEVNTNPCISPDAGFAAALDRAGIPFSDCVARILDQCF
ncbi:MAG: D-alanine--D-alanine ligase [Pseudomonadota bacterium]